MRLVLSDDYVPGCLVEGGVIDINDAVGAEVMALPATERMAAIIADWDALSGPIGRKVADGAPRSSFRLRAPLPRPSKMLFAASNYNEGEEDGVPMPLDMFMKSPSAVIDPGDEIVLPPHDAQLFFHEAELGVVIGKPAKSVGEADALDHVFGYIGVNDVSSFGLPGAIGGLRNKNFDTFCPLGPCIVTKDEVPDPHNLHIRLWIEDVLRQDYNTSDMEHRIPVLIAFASGIMTLQPGDVLACGTNHTGIGPIQHGDRVRMHIDAIGEFENIVRDDHGRAWPVGADEHFVAWVHEYKRTGKMEGEMFSARRIR